MGALAQMVSAATLHATLIVLVAWLATVAPPRSELGPVASPVVLEARLIAVIPPAFSQVGGGGGGGGGNQQAAPIRRAHGIGTDTITLPVRRAPPVAEIAVAPPRLGDLPSMPSILLDTKPLAAGIVEHSGLPAAGTESGTSTGPGSGGGVGTGRGSGIGSGRGPGVGPGTGGGTGGGAYRAGGAVSAPRLISDVRARYTAAALAQKIQGTVVLEAVVSADGCPTQIR
jgi:hypothetical protein